MNELADLLLEFFESEYAAPVCFFIGGLSAGLSLGFWWFLV